MATMTTPPAGRADAHVAVPQPPSHAWADALTAYEQATAAAVAIDSDRDEDAFDRAATVQGAAIDTLLDTPAPDMAALATKLRVIHRDGYQHRLAAVLADAERLADVAPGAGHVGWLSERNVLVDVLDREDVSEEETDAGLIRLHALDRQIDSTPAITAEDAIAKLVLLAQIATEGSEVDEVLAARTLWDVAPILGIGRVSPNVPALAREARS